MSELGVILLVSPKIEELTINLTETIGNSVISINEKRGEL